ncbi:MAG: T9SS type A sorting domain-containing protein [Ignavibacteriales bacterium]|nr:T9SS type A sorting domain-containing protein [Ignavibacteriales bacterium]
MQPKEKSYHAALGKTNDNITGHQHSGGGTACPGVNLISKYNYIRNEVYNKLNPTDIQEDEGQLISEYKLYQNYPNPFNPTTKVKYTIPKSETGEVNKVTLIVYDIMGREIETLVNENKSSGTYEIEFNASNLVSGIYFYRLKIANFISIKKMIYLK